MSSIEDMKLISLARIHATHIAKITAHVKPICDMGSRERIHARIIEFIKLRTIFNKLLLVEDDIKRKLLLDSFDDEALRIMGRKEDLIAFIAKYDSVIEIFKQQDGIWDIINTIVSIGEDTARWVECPDIAAIDRLAILNDEVTKSMDGFMASVASMEPGLQKYYPFVCQAEVNDTFLRVSALVGCEQICRNMAEFDSIRAHLSGVDIATLTMPISIAMRIGADQIATLASGGNIERFEVTDRAPEEYTDTEPPHGAAMRPTWSPDGPHIAFPRTSFIDMSL